MKNQLLTSFTTLFLITLFSMSSCNQKHSISLKLMSYNIRHGEGLDGILDLSRSAELIKSQAPDYCGLQEIDHKCRRTGSVAQADYLAQHTNTKASFGKFMDFQGGEYGMATLTSLPIISTEVLQLPDAKYEPRSSIVQELKVAENCTLTIANVHLDWTNEEGGRENRINQAKVMVSFIDKFDHAAVILGDFNCTPDSPTMQYFSEQGFIFIPKGDDNLSFQGKTKNEIDHIIYRNTADVKFNLKSIKLLEEPIISDHRPLVAELIISKKQ